MIPKRIFTVWLSEDRKIPPFIQKCIDTHKLEGYEHRLITLDNCFKDSKYIQECLNSPHGTKKWCKASDYLRMHYLLTEGGIYLDADVEILPGKNFDHLLDNQAFVGKEMSTEFFTVLCTAVVAAEAGHPLIKEWKETVEANFRGDDTLCYESSMHQLNLIGVRYQDQMQLLEPDFFYPYNNLTSQTNFTENSICIHHFAKSWTDSLLDRFTYYINAGINFSFIKRGDGELACMAGELGGNCDGHPYSQELGAYLKGAYEELADNKDVMIVEWDDQQTYNTLLHRTDSDLQRVSTFWKAVSNSNRFTVFIGPKRLEYIANQLNALFVEVPLVNAFEKYWETWYQIPIREDGIYIFCAGMMSKPLISDILNWNPKVTCLDAGSAFDPYVGPTRTHQISDFKFADLYYGLERFPLVSIIIPQLGREEGLLRLERSIEKLDYPKGKIETVTMRGPELTVPEKVKRGARRSRGEILCFMANDTEFEEDTLKAAVRKMKELNLDLLAFNSGTLLPDEGNICEHFIVRKDFIPKIGGEIFDTRLRHCGVDNLLWKKANKYGKAMRCEEARIKHHHFSKGAEFDEIYQKGWEFVEQDRAKLAEILKEENL